MSQMIRAVLARLLPVCVLLPLIGCGRVQGQFIVVQDQVPQTGCTIPGDLSALYRPEGFLDVSIVNDQSTAGYLLFPLLENDLPGTTGGIDGNRIALSGWSVHLEPREPTSGIGAVFADPLNAALVDYNVLTSGSVASGGGHTPSSVDVFQPQLAIDVRGTGDLQNGTTVIVEATVHALGNTLNGSIQSDDFRFPITVCEGCLALVQGMCPFLGNPGATGNPCNPAQDEAVDCCTANGNLFCPPLGSQ